MLSLRWFTALALLALAAGCGGDEDQPPDTPAAGGSSGSGQGGSSAGKAGAAGSAGKAGGSAGSGGAGQGGSPQAGQGGSAGSSAGSGGSTAGQGGSSQAGSGGSSQAGLGGSNGGSAQAGSGGSTAGSGGSAGQGGAAGAAGSGQAGQGGLGGDAPTKSVNFSPTDAIFANPERGFYSAVDLLDEDDLSWVTEKGHTLVFSYVRLDDWRNSSLPSSLLDQVASKLTSLRSTGLKLILRFAYNFGPYPDSEPDASKARTLEHIKQLTPLLKEHADVIALQQAGFIGAWGEWHTSTNDLLADPKDRKDILEALLAALPAERSVVIRYPPYKKEMYGGPLTEAQAWGSGFAARTGHHNDCFLSSETDVGTYPEGEVETWKQYLEQDTLYVPMGGETCAVFPARTDCAPALAEMKRLRFTFLNQDYHPDVVKGWVDQGCKPEIDRRLGYRVTLLGADLPPSVRPGGSFVLRVKLRNDGWAAPMNPRPLRAVLAAGSQRASVALPDTDARRLLPGQEVMVQARLRLPAGWPAGVSRLALSLPDPSTLGSDPRYSIRLASEGVWDAATGDNTLGEVTLDDQAPGSVDPQAKELAVLP